MKKTLCLLLAALLVLSLAACGKQSATPTPDPTPDPAPNEAPKLGKPSYRPKNIRISYGKMPAAGPAGMKTTL